MYSVLLMLQMLSIKLSCWYFLINYVRNIYVFVHYNSAFTSEQLLTFCSPKMRITRWNGAYPDTFTICNGVKKVSFQGRSQDLAGGAKIFFFFRYGNFLRMAKLALRFAQGRQTGGVGGSHPLNFGWGGVEHLSTSPDFEKKILGGVGSP